MAGEFRIIHIGKDGNKCSDTACEICFPEDDELWKAKNLKQKKSSTGGN
jgi:hypothetical protein